MVNWRTKKQLEVAQSSVEVEHRPIAQTASGLVWLKQLMEQLHCDNKFVICFKPNAPRKNET